MKNYKKIYAVIPAYNEEKKIRAVIQNAAKQGCKIIVVDDGSKDGTSIVAKKAGATVLRHIINLGKGAAAKTGCDYTLKEGADLIILMDADGQHKPEEIPGFVKTITEKKVDMVFGYRKIDNNMPFVMRFGNWFIRLSTRMIQGISIKDTQSGFRCFTPSAYKKIRWAANDYSMESEMIANAAKHKLKYAQIPIDTIYYDSFKGTTIFDGIKIFINILKFRIMGGFK